MNWFRPNKQGAREILITPGNPWQSAVLLPGNSALCAKQAIQCNRINHQTKLYVAEKNCTLEMLGALQKLKIKTTNIHPFPQLHHVKTPDDSVDFAYIDLCGNLSQKICSWMKNTLTPSLKKQSRIGVTTTLAQRGNQFTKIQRKQNLLILPQWIKKVKKQVTETQNLNLAEHISSTIKTLVDCVSKPIDKVSWHTYSDTPGYPMSLIIFDLF